MGGGLRQKVDIQPLLYLQISPDYQLKRIGWYQELRNNHYDLIIVDNIQFQPCLFHSPFSQSHFIATVNDGETITSTRVGSADRPCCVHYWCTLQCQNQQILAKVNFRHASELSPLSSIADPQPLGPSPPGKHEKMNYSISLGAYRHSKSNLQ